PCRNIRSRSSRRLPQRPFFISLSILPSRPPCASWKSALPCPAISRASEGERMGNFDFDVIIRSLPYLFFDGMWFTLRLTAFATAGGLGLGTLLALMRLSGVPVLPQVATAYVNFVRSLPLVLVIFWFYFLIPYIAQWATG